MQYKLWDIIYKSATRPFILVVLMFSDNTHPTHSLPTAISVTQSVLFIVKLPNPLGGPCTNTHLLQRDKRRQACANINTMHTLIKATTFPFLRGGQITACYHQWAHEAFGMSFYPSWIPGMRFSRCRRQKLFRKETPTQGKVYTTGHWLGSVNTYTHMHI